MRIDNPVLNRELVEYLRGRGAFLLQAIFIAILSAVVLVAWPVEVDVGLRSEVSKGIYDTFAVGQIVLLALIAPILSAPAIASERERRSLDLLMTSPLRPEDIVLGKLLSAIVYLVLLAISSLPLFTVCFFLGGIGSRQIILTFFLLLSVTYCAGAIGLAASVYLERTRNALAICYVMVMPLAILLIALNPARERVAAMGISLLAATVGTVLVVMVISRLREPFDTAPKAVDEEEREEQVGLVIQRDRFPDSLISPRSTGRPMDERLNPVYEKELRFELFGRGTLLIRTLLSVSLIAGLPFYIASLVDGQVVTVPLAGGGVAEGTLGNLWVLTFYILVFVLLLTPALAAGAFTTEREIATFDLLLTSALSRWQVVAGKVIVGLRTIGLLTAFLVAYVVLQALFYLIGYGTLFLPLKGGVFLGSLGIIGATILVTVMVACCTSMLCRASLTSMVYTYSILAFLFLAPPIVYAILTVLADHDPAAVEPYMVTSPFYAVAALEGLHHKDFSRVVGVTLPPQAGWYYPLTYMGFCVALSAVLFLAMLLLYKRCCQLRHDHGL